MRDWTHRHDAERQCVSHAQSAHDRIRQGRLDLAEYHVRQAVDHAKVADTVPAYTAAENAGAHYRNALAWLKES